MTVKTKFLCGSNGSEEARSGESVLTFEAWDDNPTTGRPSTVADFEALIASLNTAVLAACPSTFNGLYLDSLGWREEAGEHRYLFDAKYTWKAPESVIRWSFDTTGGSIKITTSKATTKYAISGRTAPDFQNAIGVKSGGEPEGVDITIPALKLTATYRHPASSSDVNSSTIDAYIRTLASMTGTTNSGTVGSYAAGELLFLGASGEFVPDKPNEFQYHFAASANATGISIGSIASIAKKGHEYIWILFEEDEDSTAKKTVQRPLAAYVERVYSESNFANLKIGF